MCPTANRFTADGYHSFINHRAQKQTDKSFPSIVDKADQYPTHQCQRHREQVFTKHDVLSTAKIVSLIGGK
jgi:hypothetical protein